MKKITTLLAALFLAGIYAFGSGSSDLTTWNGEKYETYLDFSLIEASPEWKEDPGSLPVTSMDALELTNRWMDENFQDQERSLASISLRKSPIGGKKLWAWFIFYENGKSVVGHVTEEGHEIMQSDRLSFVVTLNGDLVYPKKN